MKTKVQNGNVTLPITRTGDGQPVVYFNGIGSTQATWKKVISLLKGKYEIIIFDFRGHGQASTAQDYSFDAFVSDADNVLKVVDVDKPIVVAWSMGADIYVEVDAHRSKLMDLYLKVDCPITMIMASKPHGEKDSHNRRTNRLWREGIDRLSYTFHFCAVD